MNYKTVLQSKTIWMGLATICTGVGLFVSGEQNLQELLIAVMGVVFTTLRFYTNLPIKQ